VRLIRAVITGSISAAAFSTSAAYAADYGFALGEPAPMRVSRLAPKAYCVSCSGLPWGGLGRDYVADLPWGGVGEDCPPGRPMRRAVVLRRKG
jgi:hypothetical protein